MIDERKKIQALLEKIRQQKIMRETEKEEGLDELRREFRDEL